MTYGFWKSCKPRDEQAYLNLGDPSAFLNVYDPEKEADKVSRLHLAQGLKPEEAEAQLDQAAASDDDNEGDWMLQLFAVAPATAPPQQRGPDRSPNIAV